MKIRVAILDRDENYKSRMQRNFQVKYADKIELYIFSEIAQLESTLKVRQLDMVLVDDEIEGVPAFDGTVLVYLSKNIGVDEFNGHPAICKFQKIDTIYKEILSVYAETSTAMRIHTGENDAKVVLFMSAQGGSGCSSAAAAYALRNAFNRKNVFYLNLERFRGTELYFSGDGNMSLSEVIYSLKSKKSNLIIKLESNLKTDKSGVDFFDCCKNAYDIFELKDEEVIRLLQGISRIKEYDCIVIDVSEGVNERTLLLMEEYADEVVYVSDGSKSGNDKFGRFCQVLKLMEQRDGKNFLGKVHLLYNRYSSKTSTQLDESPVPVAGGIHRFEGAYGRELIEQIAKLDALDNI